ncbi:Ribulose-phosphate 3-epimerase [Spraguea lophii 42_110]|uniref:Ribulose-phosphate 3-epimerase n=1 Tax=Spraguea lophii (strain 42_110) TaxID=1358809 RepID=S7W5G3_SPRLO|nr:Ribulose-phosphate 3-epimerase [Spraguea lophii 42_110]
MVNKIISISLLNANLLKLPPMKNVTHLHLDIIDTTFAENISFGPQIINDILDLNFICDLHFMIDNPLHILSQINLTNVRKVYFHTEIDFVKIKKLYPSLSLGIALRPGESVNMVQNKPVDAVLLMTVNPGRGGQKFIPCPTKISDIRKIGDYEIGVDGGIDIRTINHMKDCDYFVVGSAYFRSEDKEKYIEKLKFQLK